MVRGRLRIVVLAVAAFGASVPATADIDWFGISFNVGGVHASLGYQDYPVWSERWHDPSWRMDVNLMLDGYGEWVYLGGLGRVWRPAVRASWQPYSNGRWVWTSLGWTWVAYEPWGYVPHHYGEWALTRLGWVWVPGYSYSPANVTWLRCGGHLGWLPRAPRGWSHGARSWRRGYDRGFEDGWRSGDRHGYRDGYRDGWEDARHATWVAGHDLASDNLASRARPYSSLGRADGVRLLDRAPDRRHIERLTGRRVPEAKIEAREVRLGDRSVRAVRPIGVEQDIRRHARATVERGLAPEIGRSLERGQRVTTRSGDPRPAASAMRGRQREERANRAGEPRIERQERGASSRPSRAPATAPRVTRDAPGGPGRVRAEAQPSRERENDRGKVRQAPAGRTIRGQDPAAARRSAQVERERGRSERVQREQVRSRQAPSEQLRAPRPDRPSSSASPSRNRSEQRPEARAERQKRRPEPAHERDQGKVRDKAQRRPR